jgi:hypothetical protein
VRLLNLVWFSDACVVRFAPKLGSAASGARATRSRRLSYESPLVRTQANSCDATKRSVFSFQFSWVETLDDFSLSLAACFLEGILWDFLALLKDGVSGCVLSDVLLGFRGRRGRTEFFVSFASLLFKYEMNRTVSIPRLGSFPPGASTERASR